MHCESRSLPFTSRCHRVEIRFGAIHLSIETLIVDDSDAFRRVLQARLENIGCKVVGEARTASEGLALFRSLRPRLITLDLVMPGSEDTNAETLFQTIRRESPGTAMLVISVSRRDLNAAHFLAAGAVAYLEKNFMNFDRLAITLKGVFPELDKS